MPEAIPLPPLPVPDIYSFGFNPGLLRSLPETSSAVVYDQIGAEVNPITLQVGSTIGGWTLGATKLTATNITIDSENKRILVSDGSNPRVLLGNDGL